MFVCVCVQVAAHLTLQHVVDNIKCIHTYTRRIWGCAPFFPPWLVERKEIDRQEKEDEENVYIFFLYITNPATVVHYMPILRLSKKKWKYLFCCLKKKTFFSIFFVFFCFFLACAT